VVRDNANYSFTERLSKRYEFWPRAKHEAHFIRVKCLCHTPQVVPMSPKMRNASGNISEFGAVLVIVVPLVIGLLFAGYEFAYGYMIKSNLDNAAKNAARAMAIAYGQDQTIASNQAKQQAVYTSVRVPNFVNANQQFSDPDFKPSGGSPKSVTVTVSYLPGQFNLPKFPSPDVLNLSPTLRISGTYTYRLEDE
jgi:hypothetical protein